MLLNVCPIEARSEASLRSHASARLAPPPAAGPLIAAITGFGIPAMVVTTRRPASTRARASSSRSPSSNSAR